MKEKLSNLLYEKTTSVTVKRYKFKVHSIELYWQGYSSGKMEDMPGNFLEQTISLIGCKKPSPLESLAVQNQVILHREKKETTNEPKGYADLKHQHLIESLKTNTKDYLQKLASVVRENLISKPF